MKHGSQNWLKPVLDFIFPPRCLGCKKRGKWLCVDCVSHFARVQQPVCRICGNATAGTVLCSYCYKTPLRIDGIRAPHYFEGILRETIHRFKYQHATHLAQPLAEVLVAYLQAHLIEFAMLVPVPLHGLRFKQRGYNQSELLATELGAALGVPVVNALIRVKETKSQMNLPAGERKANVRGAFVCQDESVSGKKVLLIDDVCTTGATLEACSIALRQSKTASVWGLCAARAKLGQQNPHIADSLTPW